MENPDPWQGNKKLRRWELVKRDTGQRTVSQTLTPCCQGTFPFPLVSQAAIPRVLFVGAGILVHARVSCRETRARATIEQPMLLASFRTISRQGPLEIEAPNADH